ncbi:MAG: amidohydrolase [Acidobacteria bacterium]|nr:MAG: amidohydrolase [Acidobacteriota bacterium]
MRAFRLATLAVLVGLASPVPASVTGTAPPLGLRPHDPERHAFVHARIVIAPGTAIDDGLLLTEGERVAYAGPMRTPPAGAAVHDLAGKTIYPGFIDPYTEYGLPPSAPAPAPEKPSAPRYEAERQGPSAWNEAIHAEIRWADRFVPNPEQAKPYLERGVTAVGAVRLDGIFRGRGFAATLAARPPNETLLVADGPQFLSFDKGSSRQAYPSSLMGSIALIRQTLLDARWYRQAHDAYALDPNQPRPEFNSALEALTEPAPSYVFETTDELMLLRAARLAAEFGLAAVFVGSGYEYRQADAIAALGRPLILPVSLPPVPPVAAAEDARDVTLAQLRHWERAPRNAAELARRGVRFAFTAHGLRKEERFWDNLRKIVRAGLAEEAALAALTTVPAEILGIDGVAGTLEPGRRADFVIAGGDPFRDEVPFHEVWIGGRRARRIVPLDQRDFRGRYRLVAGGRDLTLEIGGRPTKPSGTLSWEGAETPAKLRELRLEPKRLFFAAAVEPLGGVLRVVLDARREPPVASVTLPDGTTESAGITPLEEEPDTAGEREAEPSSEETPLVSRLTQPPVAFGLERLPEPETVLIRHATLWTMSDRGTLEDADILLDKGRIARIGRGLRPPRGARVIDGRGRHVTPGIVDAHSHIAVSRGVNEGSHSVTAEVRIADVLNPYDISIYRALAGGVTTALVLHGSANAIGGQSQVIKLRWGRPAEDLKFAAAAPTIKFALGENVKQSNWGDRFRTRYPQTRMGVEAVMRDALLAARRYQEQWRRYRALPEKKRRRTVPPRRDLQLEALAEVLDGKRLVHAHSYVQSEILMLMRLAEEFGFRIGTFTHVLEGYKVAPEIAAHGAGGSTFSDWWAYKFEVYEAIPHNACLMHRRGVVTSINSDSPETMRRLPVEAAKTVMYCGLSPEEALAMVTIAPARQLRVDDRIGSLEEGKDADVVVWNGNPLSVYSRVETTFVDGMELFSRERDLAERRKIRAEREALIQKALRAGAPARQGKGRRETGPEEEPEWHCDDVVDVWHAR